MADIKIIIDNEVLDIDTGTLVTFKKSQQLNGLQDQYSYSNNFTVKNSSKNRRLLKINYLPNSKAKSMTAGYSVDVVLSGSIFLKKQTLKVQKETNSGIPVYLIFTDSYFVAKAKEVLLNQIDFGTTYTKTLAEFQAKNTPFNPMLRTAPISAQDKSGLVVVEEVPALINVKEFTSKIFEQLGYSFTGDILTDEFIGQYWTSSTVGVYGPDGAPKFEDTKTCYDFIVDLLETFNGYLEVNDSSKALGLFLWKNIETLKDNFVDYSSKFTGFDEYSFEGGLARVNTLSYTESESFYNGFFNNNKSIVDKTEYLNSNFGAGSLKLFADQEVTTVLSIDIVPPRPIGETTEPKIMNLFRFETTLSPVQVFSGGAGSTHNFYKAFSPNILEIWERFHKPYCDNIALPTIANINFRYDAIFLANFKMSEVFFIKQLSTYWLPLELNFTSKRDVVRVKALMIEKTAADVPEVFDFNVSIGFYGESVINNMDLLYSAANTSPAATMTITDADLTKNDIFINGTQVLAFPTVVDVSSAFEIKIDNIETVNAKNNSDILFRFTSEAGGVSREAKLNVKHNGSATFISEFRSAVDTVFNYGVDDTDNHQRNLNYSAKITTPLNIPDTYAPAIGDIDFPAAPTAFKVLKFDKKSNVSVDLSIEYLYLQCSNRGGTAEARTKIFFDVWINGAVAFTLYSAGVIDRYSSGDRSATYTNIQVHKTFRVNVFDEVFITAHLDLSEEDRFLSGTMDGHVSMKNVNWKFTVTEQI